MDPEMNEFSDGEPKDDAMGGGMGGGMGDDMSDDDYTPPAELPEGITKEIIKAADDSSWEKPKNGDQVFVHYVGTLESGEEFDSSRSRNREFDFILGSGGVIKGWDEGVKTMKKGELAKFTLSPEYAYGEAGSPPKIPANATLIFEIELLRWVSKSDLFQDGGVIKDELTKGSGWKKPKEGDEIKVTMQAYKSDGETLVEEKLDFEYVVGGGNFGKLSKVVDTALTGMKKGEEAKLTCTEAYAYGADQPGGAILKLTLQEVYEVKDISFAKNNTLMKKQVVEGEGYEQAQDASSVKLSVEAATDGSAPLAGFTPSILEFTAGNGEVCDALELVACEMKKGEKAILTCFKPALCAEAKLGLKNLGCEKVVLTLQMVNFDKHKDTWSMDEDEKLTFGNARKGVGADLVKAGRFELALERYKKVCNLFNYIDNLKEENKIKAKEIKKLSELNQALCQLKLKDWTAAKTSCNNVLKEDPQNVKALYRRAQCDFELKNFQDCMIDVKKVINLEPQNKPARDLLKSAQAGQKEDDKKAKGLFQNMVKGLGRGPIPEPTKMVAGDDDMDMDDEDEEDLPDASPEEKPAEEAKANAE